MPINTLTIQGVRNLKDVHLTLSNKINIFFGDNAVGKTSVLESIYLLAMARSFRTSKIKSVFGPNSNTVSVSGSMLDDSLLFMSRTQSGKVKLAYQGKELSSVAELAQIFPVQVLYSDSFKILEGSPKDRRVFLDWGVFHQFPEFYEAWKNFSKILKHRNSMLRKKVIDSYEFDFWQQKFIKVSETLDSFREQYVLFFVRCFLDLLNDCIDLPNLTLEYYRGWGEGKSLKQTLNDSFERDKKLGLTHFGPHRADLYLKWGDKLAIDVLSRGQLKLVVCVLKFAQAYLFAQYKRQAITFLIDDLPSELDPHYIEILCNLLNQFDCQLCLSCIDFKPFKEIWMNENNMRMFHVKHGIIQPVMEFGEPV